MRDDDWSTTDAQRVGAEKLDQLGKGIDDWIAWQTAGPFEIRLEERPKHPEKAVVVALKDGADMLRWTREGDELIGRLGGQELRTKATEQARKISIEFLKKMPS